MARHTRKRNRTHTRARTRLSRPLIAVLGITIAVGLGAYFYNIKKTHAAQADRERISLKAVAPGGMGSLSSRGMGSLPMSGSSTSPVKVPAVAAPPTPGVLVTQTPSGLAAAGTATAPAANTGKTLVTPHTGKMPAPPNTGKLPVPPNADKTPVPVKTAAVVIAPPVILAAASVPSNQPPLVEGKAKMDAGDLLGARAILNAALTAGHLTPADAASARHLLSEISQTVLFSNKPIQGDPAQTLYQVKSGDRLSRVAERHGVTWELLCRINGLADPRKVRAGQWIKIPTGPFHCVITKSDYRLDVYLGSPGEAGSVFVTTLQVGLGKDNSTPTGMWIVAPSGKIHPATYYSPRGEGVIAADDPKNPLGGYWMGLSGVAGNALEKNSYGIHGTIEPDSIGKQASMGCIRLRHDDIALLYDLLVEGKSKVLVKD